MKFLKTLLEVSLTQDPASIRLTHTQQVVLVSIYAAPTPETAYDTTTGTENITLARQQLHQMGLIVMDDSSARAGVTDAGQESLTNHNMIDDTGQLTEEGNKMLELANSVKAEFENATESVNFGTLRNLI